MDNNKNYISLGTLDKYIIIIIIGGIGKFFGGFITSKFGNLINNHPLILGINGALGMSLSLFPFIFIRISLRKANKNEIKLKQNKLIYTNTSKLYYRKMRIQKYLLILLSSILDFGQKFLTYLYIESIENNFWIFDTLFVNVFSIFILKIKLYKFQYLSLLIIILLGLILNIINLYNLSGKALTVLIIFAIEIMYSLKNVINKYSMEFNFCIPYEIGFYEGFFALIIYILLLKYTNKDNFNEYYESLDSKEIIVFIFLMLSRWIFNLFGLITIKKYTTSHIILVLIIGEIAFAIMNEYNWKLYITIIIFLILLFMLLVFTEIIELNFWGLQNDTKKNILKRVRLQEMDDNSDMTSDLSEEENPHDSLGTTPIDDMKEKLSIDKENNNIND